MRLEIEAYAELLAATFVSPAAVYRPKATDVTGDSVVRKRKYPTTPVMFGIERSRTSPGNLPLRIFIRITETLP